MCPVIRRWQPYLLLAFLGVLFFADVVLHPDQVLYSDHSDLLAMHLPMKRFLVRSFQETGEIPLWCPYSFAGMPFIHDVQVAAFYPLHLPLYLLPENWVGPGLSWLVAIHVILAGWCMFAYARSQGLDGTPALLAALGYMFAGKWLLHVLAGGHYVMIPLAWLPLVLLCLEQAIRRCSLLYATWSGVAFAFIVLGTHPQMTLYAGVFVAVWSLGCVAKPQGDLDFGFRFSVFGFPLLRWLGFGAWTGLVATALSAVQLLPALEAAPESTRAVGVAPGEIVAAAFPSLFGLVGPGWAETWEDRAGLGMLWIAAAIAAPLLYHGRVRFQAGVCLALLFFSLGGAALIQWLPGFRFFQIPVRMLMLLALPVALLAGKTTQALLTEQEWSVVARERCRRVLQKVLFVGVLLAASSGVVSFLRWQQSSDTHLIGSPRVVLQWLTQVPFGTAVYWTTLVLAVPAAFWLLRRNCTLTGRAWGCAWSAILLAELWAVAWPHGAVRPLQDIYRPSACIQDLVHRRQRNPTDSWRVLERGLAGQPSSAPLGAALPMLGSMQIEPILGYNSFDIRRYKEYLQFVMDKDEPVRPREGIFGYPIVEAFPIRNKSLLDLLGTRYLLEPRDDVRDLDGPAEPARCRSWQAIAVDEHPAAYSFLAGGRKELPAYTVYENLDCYPRAFVVHHAVRLADRAAVLQQLKTTDFNSEVLLEGLVPEGPSVPAPAGVGSEAARILEYWPNRVALEVKATAPGYLVLTDIWFPGWICTIDGEPVTVSRADFLFRAVQVAAGTHEVIFKFAPTSYTWGKRISGLALAMIALLTLSLLLKKRWLARTERRKLGLGRGDRRKDANHQDSSEKHPLADQHGAAVIEKETMRVGEHGLSTPRFGRKG
jgi:hypothetical protein